MTREEGKEFANALKNNYTIDFDKLPEFCDLVISALEKNESAEEWYKLLCEKWDSAENKGEWIPVYERLPKDGQSVLFCDIDEDIMIGYHVKGRPDSHFSQDGTYEDMKNVRAWMPLPEPYKAEKEE